MVCGKGETRLRVERGVDLLKLSCGLGMQQNAGEYQRLEHTVTGRAW